VIPLLALDTAAHSPAAGGDTLTYLALGDSYTIGQSVPVGQRYPVQAVSQLRIGGITCKDPEIIAVTGWTTADLLAAMPAVVSEPPYHIVSLLIGVNNQYQGQSQSAYREQFTNLLQQCIHLAGDRPSHVMVLSIPDYSVTPFAKGANRPYIAAQIDSFNSISRQISGDYKVQYLDITAESRKAAADLSLVAVDGLHFSGKEYEIWAAMMVPLIEEMQ